MSDVEGRTVIRARGGSAILRLVQCYIVLAIVLYKASYIEEILCTRMICILESIQSQVPTIKPFGEQSLKTQQRPSGPPRPVRVYHCYQRLTFSLCIVSLHSSLKMQAYFRPAYEARHSLVRS